MARKRVLRLTAAEQQATTTEAPAPTRGRRRKAAMPAARIRVRMYRQGLGDCFLVSLLPAEGAPFHLLIDCGVILGTSNAAATLQQVVQDIIATTGGETKEGFVDVLAVTHEHYDHVAGFVLARDLFAPAGKRTAGKLAVGEVWFAWTEDPANATASRLRESRAARLKALSALAARVQGMGAAPAADVSDALRFFGIGADGAGQGTTALAMRNAASLAPPDGVVYRHPGEAFTLAGAPGLKFYVLGPPEDEKALRRTDSSTEVYHLDSGDLDATVARLAGLAGDLGDDADQPFEPAYTHRLSDLRDAARTGALAEFLAKNYFGPTQATPESDQSWRRIDGDWLAGAEQLALALDGATNNTSLVLAIEIAASGKVLLFPADAQVGNWLSWQSVTCGSGAAAVTGPELLRRTVFYKVGHHGSHNATLKEHGLEAMTSPDLVAFIPVDHAMAVKKRWGRMPLPELVDALNERTHGRVVRIDEDLPAGLGAVTAGPPGGPLGALWYEWTLPLD
ncbi:MAG: hypothetical protein WAS21_09110 [Geminicoccaceae bacterium]